MSQKIQEAFEKFDAENPQVYERLKRLSMQLVIKGHKHYGISGLFEVLRWQHAMETTGNEFKLNNNFRAHYARLLMKNEPILAAFFRTRESPRISQHDS